MRIAVLSFAIVGLATSPSAAQSSTFDHDFRVAANFAMGVGGELDLYTSTRVGGGASTDNHGESNLDPSIGFDLRGEGDVADFLSIGGWFEFLGVLVDATDAEREEYFAFDLYARPHYTVEVATGAFWIEPYVLLPFGLSLSPLPATPDDGDDVWVGWNTAILGGAQFLHASGFGGYVEVGWRHAEAYRSESTTVLGTTVDAKGSLVLNEVAINIGAVFAI